MVINKDEFFILPWGKEQCCIKYNFSPNVDYPDVSGNHSVIPDLFDVDKLKDSLTK